MEAKDQILARMYVMLTLLGVMPVLIAVQVFRIGLVDTDGLRTQGEQQSSSYVDIPALRGAILDRTGRTLAVDVERFDVVLDPTAPTFASNEAAFFERLSRLIGQPVSRIRRTVRDRQSPKYVLLARNADLTSSKVQEVNAIPGAHVEPRFARRYNYLTTASHMLGHVDADHRGIAGLESTYEEHLKGVPGSRAAQRDRRGVRKVIAGGAVVQPKHGESIVLTIDLVRQTILEEELARGVADAGARWGTAIAMNPVTGEIMAMANVPTYDSNRPGSFDTFSRRNHAVTDRIEPGSTFKLVGAVASIATNVIAMGDTVDTGPGWIVQHGRTLNDTHPHGRIPFSEVISLSSNVGFAIVVNELDPGDFYQTARNLGFGQLTGVDVPGEVAGRLKRTSEWSGTTLSAMSRGYEIEATPLQLLAAYSAFANGGLLVRPYLVSSRWDVTGKVIWEASQDSVRRAFSADVAEELLPAFEAVINEGTATTARIEGLRIAGKTGTARKTKNGVYDPGSYRATFVGFFPVEAPEVAMIVVMDEPKSSIYGGSVASPVFRRTAERWLSTLPGSAEAVASGVEERRDSLAAVPDVTGLPEAVARRKLKAMGLLTGSGFTEAVIASVAEQNPVPGSIARPGEGFELNLSKEVAADSTMPDVRGLGSRAASFALASRGVRVRLEGQGQVVGQWPSAGEELPEEAVLRCR